MGGDKRDPADMTPGEGEGIDEASRDAVRELEKRGDEGNAGAGDIG
ncbi:MAG TPA: hypothetical protein VEW25_02320 [Allosphingosinicella sp.]|nr:hypothetical protein [Allosphingosinicella sp.]